MNSGGREAMFEKTPGRFSGHHGEHFLGSDAQILVDRRRYDSPNSRGRLGGKGGGAGSFINELEQRKGARKDGRRTRSRASNLH